MKKNFFVLFLSSLCFAVPVKNTFNVQGMMCGYGCVSKINSLVTDLKGVKECNVDFENTRINDYDNVHGSDIQDYLYRLGINDRPIILNYNIDNFFCST